MSGLPPASPPPRSAALDRDYAASELPSPRKLDYDSPVRSPAAPAAPEPAAPESITSKVFGMIGEIASSLAAGLIPPEMIVDAIEKSEAAIGKAVGMMPPAQKTQFKQVLQRIVMIIEQQGARRRTLKHRGRKVRRTRRA